LTPLARNWELPDSLTTTCGTCSPPAALNRAWTFLPFPAGTATANGQAVAANGVDKKAIAQAKAKYGYPWWVSANPLEVFWGQLNEEVQIVPLDKYLFCAQEAMKREVFGEEFADRQALKDELMERVAKATLDEITAKLQARTAAQPIATQAVAKAAA
jgi:hypothetical protein